jgi:hypothetical protein
MMKMPVITQTIALLILSNLFMTFAWYGHLKNLQGSKWYIAAIASWSIALFRYLIQVPANRIDCSLDAAAAQNHAGGRHALDFRAVFHLVHEATHAAQLSVGVFMPAGRGLFHL